MTKRAKRLKVSRETMKDLTKGELGDAVGGGMRSLDVPCLSGQACPTKGCPLVTQAITCDCPTITTNP